MKSSAAQVQFYEISDIDCFEFIIQQLMATVMKEQCETLSDWNNT